MNVSVKKICQEEDNNFSELTKRMNIVTTFWSAWCWTCNSTWMGSL